MMVSNTLAGYLKMDDIFSFWFSTWKYVPFSVSVLQELMVLLQETLNISINLLFWLILSCCISDNFHTKL